MDTSQQMITGTQFDGGVDVQSLNARIEVLENFVSSITTDIGSKDATVGQIIDENETSFFDAVEKGDFNALLKMLVHGVDVNQRNEHGDTALHMTSAKGHIEATIVLLGVVDVNSLGQHLKRPLHWAVDTGNIKMCNVLLSANADVDVDVEDAAGATPLALAASSGHMEIVKSLLHTGASVDAVDRNGETPLLRAAREGHFEAVEALLHAGASPTELNDKGESALYYATRSGNVPIVKYLLSRGASKEPKQVEDALLAAEKPALVWAFAEEIDSKLFIKIGGKGFLNAVGKKNHELMVSYLCAEIPVDTACEGKYAILIASGMGNIEMLRELLSWGPNIDVQDWNGDTALHLTAKGGFQSCIEVLLQNRPKVLHNKQGYTPGDCSISPGITDLLQNDYNL